MGAAVLVGAVLVFLAWIAYRVWRAFSAGGLYVTLRWTFSTGGFSLVVTQENWKMELEETMKVGAAIEPIKANGEPGQIDGVPSWLVSDPAVGAWVVDETDPKKAFFVPNPIPEGEPDIRTTGVAVEVDADLGEGVRLIRATGEVSVKRAGVVTLRLTFGEPVPQ